MQMNKTDLIKMVAEKANKPTKEVAYNAANGTIHIELSTI